MKCIIAGSRHNFNVKQAWNIINETMKDIEVSDIIGGRAIGMDKLGEDYANLHNIHFIPMPVSNEEWNKYGKAAGHLRNMKMAEVADMAVVIWNGVSPGSKNMVDCMKKLKKPYVLKLVDEEIITLNKLPGL